jgi:hypothetical protein
MCILISKFIDGLRNIEKKLKPFKYALIFWTLPTMEKGDIFEARNE